jgi:hypothetical protein
MRRRIIQSVLEQLIGTKLLNRNYNILFKWVKWLTSSVATNMLTQSLLLQHDFDERIFGTEWQIVDTSASHGRCSADGDLTYQHTAVLISNTCCRSREARF